VLLLLLLLPAFVEDDREEEVMTDVEEDVDPLAFDEDDDEVEVSTEEEEDVGDVGVSATLEEVLRMLLVLTARGSNDLVMELKK